MLFAIKFGTFCPLHPMTDTVVDVDNQQLVVRNQNITAAVVATSVEQPFAVRSRRIKGVKLVPITSNVIRVEIRSFE